MIKSTDGFLAKGQVRSERSLPRSSLGPVLALRLVRVSWLPGLEEGFTLRQSIAAPALDPRGTEKPLASRGSETILLSLSLPPAPNCHLSNVLLQGLLRQWACGLKTAVLFTNITGFL